MIECKVFRPYVKNYLQGYANLYISEWGVELRGCKLFMKDDKRWVRVPSIQYEDKDGEKHCNPYISFENIEVLNTFSDKSVKAIDKWCQRENEND